MPHTIVDKIKEWSRSYTSPSELEIDLESATDEEVEIALGIADKHYPSRLERIESQIYYLANRLYSEFEITKYPPYHPDFIYRLRDWLKSTPNEEDQKILFELVPRLFFIGNNEYLSLYKSAFNGPIIRWLTDQLELNLESENYQSLLHEAISSTWFCALTDSMKISTFYHVNQIEGFDLRPDWTVLTEFASREEIKRYMKQQRPQIERIVLLEDFVGTGSQIDLAVKFATNLSSDFPILLCPLVICLPGCERGRELEKRYSNLTFEPTLILDKSVVLSNTPSKDEETFLSMLRDVVNRTYTIVKGSNPGLLYGPFGYGESQQGGGLLVVLHTNCPDNTLPLIHHRSDGPWHPIFPRSSRI